MVFLPIFLFAAYANLILAVRGLIAKGRAALVAQAHFAVCLVGALGALLGFELVPDAGNGIAGDAYNWAPVAFFVFGLLTVVLFGARLLLLAHDASQKKGPALRYVIAIWAVLAGLYICGAVVDHWIFFRDRDHSGVADPGYFGGASVCQTSVLVRLEGNRAVYRCPNLIAFGRDYQTPFVPWPSYRQAEADGTALKHDVDAAHVVDEGRTGRANHSHPTRMVIRWASGPNKTNTVSVPPSDIRIQTN